VLQEPPPPTETVPTIPIKGKEDVKGAVQSPDFLIYSILLAVILLAAALVFYFLDRWRKTKPDYLSEREASLSLSSFRELYENGEMTEAEYLKIREKLATQMRAKGASTIQDQPTPAKNPTPEAEPKQPPNNPQNPTS
jgi:hypothetical protein